MLGTYKDLHRPIHLSQLKGILWYGVHYYGTKRPQFGSKTFTY